MTHNPITNPTHYKQHPSGIETIKIAKLGGFILGNAIKYLFRYEHKGDPINDLKKARYLLQSLTKTDAADIELINSPDPQGAIALTQSVLNHEPSGTPLSHTLKLLQEIIFSASSPGIEFHGPKAIEAINKRLDELDHPTRTTLTHKEIQEAK